jgi:hypothetical protein
MVLKIKQSSKEVMADHDICNDSATLTTFLGSPKRESFLLHWHFIWQAL